MGDMGDMGDMGGVGDMGEMMMPYAVCFYTCSICIA
jgi:hypothetical protein